MYNRNYVDDRLSDEAIIRKILDFSSAPLKNWISDICGKSPEEVFGNYVDEMDEMQTKHGSKNCVIYLTTNPNLEELKKYHDELKKEETKYISVGDLYPDIKELHKKKLEQEQKIEKNKKGDDSKTPVENQDDQIFDPNRLIDLNELISVNFPLSRGELKECSQIQKALALITNAVVKGFELIKKDMKENENKFYSLIEHVVPTLNSNEMVFQPVQFNHLAMKYTRLDNQIKQMSADKKKMKNMPKSSYSNNVKLYNEALSELRENIKQSRIEMAKILPSDVIICDANAQMRTQKMKQYKLYVVLEYTKIEDLDHVVKRLPQLGGKKYTDAENVVDDDTGVNDDGDDNDNDTGVDDNDTGVDDNDTGVDNDDD